MCFLYFYITFLFFLFSHVTVGTGNVSRKFRSLQTSDHSERERTVSRESRLFFERVTRQFSSLPNRAKFSKRTLPVSREFHKFHGNQRFESPRISQAFIGRYSLELASGQPRQLHETRGREATNETNGSSGRRVEYFTACLTATMARQKPWESTGRRRVTRKCVYGRERVKVSLNRRYILNIHRRNARCF